MANKLIESESEALSIFADTDSESFEGFNSSDIRAAENNLRSKIQSKSKKHDNHAVNDTEPSCSTSNKINSSEVGPNNEKGKKSVKNVPQKRKATNKGKALQNKKKKKDSNITDALLSMSTEEIDNLKI